MPTPKTIFDKIWDAHLVQSADGAVPLIDIDYQLLTELDSAPAFERLRQSGREFLHPDRAVATVDRNVSSKSAKTPEVEKLIQTLVENCRENCIGCFGIGNVNQGLIHVVAPEQGIVQPGRIIVSSSRYASTCGALGALAFQVNSIETERVLAEQSLPMEKPKSMEIRFDGSLPKGTSAKDLAFFALTKLSGQDYSSFAIELTGAAVREMNMTGRLTLCCTLSALGASACMIAPDEKTVKYLKGRPHCPVPGPEFAQAASNWLRFRSDDSCQYDSSIQIDVSAVKPMVTWGTAPNQNAAIDDPIPDPALLADSSQRQSALDALEFMGLQPGQKIDQTPIDAVFIGSCANGRLGDLREAAKVVKGYKCSPNVTAVISPGSGIVKMKAEAAGLDKIFLDAGFQWGEPGSVQFEDPQPGQRIASTGVSPLPANGERIHLVSPVMAAAAAVTGKITDFRNWEYK
ncbi:MAG: 3-isopropylmalate dehydratase large subunit [Thermoguttaceae bacterium]|nr:3-isopropylmalate dehydratase large subunit [Thermoguttaceae bacterium]